MELMFLEQQGWAWVVFLASWHCFSKVSAPFDLVFLVNGSNFLFVVVEADMARMPD